jgi:hypothetical protein
MRTTSLLTTLYHIFFPHNMCSVSNPEHDAKCVMFILQNAQMEPDTLLPCGHVLGDFALKHIKKYVKETRNTLEYRPPKSMSNAVSHLMTNDAPQS